MVEYFFVYGTLRQEFGHEIMKDITPHITYLSEASINAKLYYVNPYPALVLSDKQNDKVIGDVFEIKSAQKLFSITDDYEGIDEPPFEYERKKVTIESSQGQRLQAWTYIYRLPTHQLMPIENGNFLTSYNNGLLTGARL